MSNRPGDLIKLKLTEEERAASAINVMIGQIRSQTPYDYSWVPLEQFPPGTIVIYVSTIAAYNHTAAVVQTPSGKQGWIYAQELGGAL